jgi:hypothetical protein
VVVIHLCRVLQLPVVIITKGVSESRDLQAKLFEYLDGSSRHCRRPYALLSKGHGRRNILAASMLDELQTQGFTVVVNTHTQIQRVTKAIWLYKRHSDGDSFVIIDRLARKRRKLPKGEESSPKTDYKAIQNGSFSTTRIVNPPKGISVVSPGSMVLEVEIVDD